VAIAFDPGRFQRISFMNDPHEVVDLVYAAHRRRIDSSTNVSIA